MKLFMSLSICIAVTIIKIHKYLDMLLTDGIYWNSHTERVSFQNQLLPELACFRAFCNSNKHLAFDPQKVYFHKYTVVFQ